MLAYLRGEEVDFRSSKSLLEEANYYQVPVLYNNKFCETLNLAAVIAQGIIVKLHILYQGVVVKFHIFYL